MNFTRKTYSWGNYVSNIFFEAALILFLGFVIDGCFRKGASVCSFVSGSTI